MNVLYTAIFNNHDTLEELDPRILLPGWRFRCFTDQPLKSFTWEIVKLPVSKKIWRKVKILPHRFLSPHEYSVWIDANITPHVNLDDFVRGKKFLAMEHPHRNNIYDEANACINLGKDSEETIRAQIASYGQSVPGLIASGVLVRRDCQSVRELDTAWWAEVDRWSVRDQLSFNYVAYKQNFEYETFPFLEGFTIRPHA